MFVHLCYQILASGYWLPDTGFQILASRSWLSDPGFHILASDPGYSMGHFKEKVQHLFSQGDVKEHFPRTHLLYSFRYSKITLENESY